jgi:hypothetical protein
MDAGGKRHMQQQYQDQMAIVRKRGKPDFFITFTCNPQWLEVTEMLLRDQKVMGTSPSSPLKHAHDNQLTPFPVSCSPSIAVKLLTVCSL